jgi:chemotaxis protein MotB
VLGAKRKIRGIPRKESGSYWMSYSDMMSALLLMFVLLLFLTFTRYTTMQQSKEQELADKQALLESQEYALETAQTQLAERQTELATATQNLNLQQLRLDEQQGEIDTKNAALSQQELDMIAQQAQLDAAQAALDEKDAQLTSQAEALRLAQEQIDTQANALALTQTEIDNARIMLSSLEATLASRETALNTQSDELVSQQTRVADLEALLTQQKTSMEAQAAQIEELVGVRTRIIRQLRDAFSGEGLSVAVDVNTGAIVMDSTVFFDTDRAALTAEGRMLLGQLLPVYLRTLMQSENAEFVSDIIIEGHTDSDGSYEHNLDLSQRRAQAVVTYCLSDAFTGLTAEEKDKMRLLISANGCSESRLIYDANGAEDKAASRRVEIKFRLKDAEMIQNLSEMLEGFDGAQ